MSKKQKKQSSSTVDAKKVDEVALLKEEISTLKAQIELLEKESNQKILEFVEKKSKEASEIIAKKEKEISEKYKAELENSKSYLYESQFASLVSIISQFESVLNMTTDPAVANYLAGFKMFLSQFHSLLDDLNISLIVPKIHDEFDSEIMEASSTVDVEDANLENKVIRVFLNGYKLKRRVIKLASVEVGRRGI